ncbi:hypothetical protein PM8797T_20473 [Gimesia maris DSM 8797]|nr:hypothetical protein PM8797T_20473 [Gimesia maris DSM 8797]
MTTININREFSSRFDILLFPLELVADQIPIYHDAGSE